MSGPEAPGSTISLTSLWPRPAHAIWTQHTLGLRLHFPDPIPLSWRSPACFAPVKAHPSFAHSVPQGVGSSTFHLGPAMWEESKALTLDTTLHPICLPPALFCPLDCWPLHPERAECPYEPCPTWPDSSIPVLFIIPHSQDPSNPFRGMPGERGSQGRGPGGPPGRSGPTRCPPDSGTSPPTPAR